MTDNNPNLNAQLNPSTVPPIKRHRLLSKPVLLIVGPTVAFVGSWILSLTLPLLAQIFASDPTNFKQASDQNVLFSIISILANVFLYIETIALIMIIPCLIAGIVLALKHKK